ncbi:hypothetical protein ACSBR2_031559 [Camellia fascicularis]
MNTKQVVDRVSKVSLKYVYLALGSCLAAFFHVVCWMVTGERQSAGIRSLYLRTLLRQEIGFFDTETNTGEIIGRISGDTFFIQDAMGKKVGKFMQVVASFFGGLVIALIKGWLITLVLLCSIPPLVISTTIMIVILAKMTSRGQRAYSLARTVAEQAIGSIRTVESFSGERKAINRYKKSLIKAYRFGVQVGLALGLGLGVFLFLMYITYALATWYGAKMIIHKGYTGGQVLNCITAMLTALVGHSGSRKSTVINLIERFYDPQAGEVLIDGINIKEFQLRWIRGKIGFVSQEPVLFTSSIRDNIAYGKDGATIEEIKVASNLANAAKFIDKLPQRLDTMVGKHGIQMSGGQKQRITTARAILKDPRILLLDEATSALDAKFERTVQEALDRVMINRTTIIVAHRLGTVKHADMMAVIHEEQIVEKGSHSELAHDPEGAFCQLLRLQELSKESEQKNADDQDEPEIILDSRRHSISFPVPTATDILETTTAEPTTPASATLQAAPLRCLAYLSKPMLLIGSIPSVILGLVMTLFGVLLANIIKIFYEPAHELRKDSKFWASMFVLLGVVALLATSIRTYVFASAGYALALIFQNAATAIAGLVIAFQETGYYSGHGASCRT